MLKFTLIVVLNSIYLFLAAQPKSFELENPNAILLDSGIVSQLFDKQWEIHQIDTKVRGQLIEKTVFGTLHYTKEGVFYYNGRQGNWQIVEDRYLKHQLLKQKDEQELNFGGIYAVIALAADTLVLSKVLTSTSDMTRTIYLTNFKLSVQANSNKTILRKKLSAEQIDSIRYLSTEALFISGFIINYDFIGVPTTDSVYWIERKKK